MASSSIILEKDIFEAITGKTEILLKNILIPGQTLKNCGNLFLLCAGEIKKRIFAKIEKADKNEECPEKNCYDLTLKIIA